MSQVWFADVALAAGTLQGLHDWWSGLVYHGPMYGYYSNVWLIFEPPFCLHDPQKFFDGVVAYPEMHVCYWT